ncbi:recombination-associated protein RdgC [Paucibacter sp. O1-1]|nr:recombination-associated protein RdgC [Paucibacter sp. O1-1]
MLKNLIVYRIGADMPASAAALEEALQKHAFAKCQPTEATSSGWVPPRGHENGALVEELNGHWLIQLQTEERILPSSVVADRVEEMVEQIEEQTGRKPGRKATKDLKEQATLELLPLAFTKRATTSVWIDTKARLMLIDAGSQGKADALVSLLVKTVPDAMNLHLLQTLEPPSACMAAWLMDGDTPEGFTIDRETELKSEDEMKSVVRYGRHSLDTAEVRLHLTQGKRPTRLAMTFKDRVSFILTDGLVIKKVAFLDLAFEGKDKPERDGQFDADFFLATEELSAMVAALIDGLGGEHVFAIEAVAAGQEPPQYPAPHMPNDGDDPLYDQAVELVQHHRKASISLVQRHLRIGYNRAARLLEAMEKSGLVSAMQTDGSRQVREGEPA